MAPNYWASRYIELHLLVTTNTTIISGILSRSDASQMCPNRKSKQAENVTNSHI